MHLGDVHAWAHLMIASARSTCMAALLVGSLSGCGDDDDTVAEDAGPDSAAPVDAQPPEIPSPVAPSPPAPPDLLPCPAGLVRTTTPFGLPYCALPDLPETCAPGARRSTESAGCVVVGHRCPSGPFPALAPAGAIYVWADAPAGSADGTREHPFLTLDAAVDAAEDGDTILVGKGTYRESITLSTDIEVRGACAEETRLTSPGSTPTLQVGANAFALRDIAIESTNNTAIVVIGAETLLDGVTFTGGGVRTANGPLTMHDVSIRDIEHPLGRAVLCQNTTCTLSHVWIADVDASGFRGENSTYDLADVIVERVRDTTSLLSAVFFTEDVDVTAQRFFARGASAAITGFDSSFTVTDSELSAMTSAGVFLREGSTLHLSRVTLRDTGAAGVIGYARTQTELDDVLILGGTEGANGSGGIVASDVDTGSGGGHSSITARRLWIESPVSSGIEIDGDVALDVEDLEVHDVQLWRGLNGGGVTLVGTAAHIARARFDGIYGAAVAAAGTRASGERAPATADLMDIDVRALRARAGGLGSAFGLAAIDGGSIRIERFRVADFVGVGLGVMGAGSRIEGVDLETRGARSGGSPTTYERSVQIADGASADLTRLAVHGSIAMAIAALPSSDVVLHDVTIDGVEPRRCADEDCAPLGVGLGVYGDAHVAVDGFTIAGCALCGGHLAFDGALTLERGAFLDNGVALCIEQPSFDLSSISSNVVFRGNGSDLESMMLPVPGVATR